MSYVKIGNREWSVMVTKIIESFNILYSGNTGRTLSVGARMVLDPLGTFYGHKITFKRLKGFEDDFDRLFDYVSKPRFDGIPVEIVHNQTTIAYDAYISTGEREVERINKPLSGFIGYNRISSPNLKT